MKKMKLAASIVVVALALGGALFQVSAASADSPTDCPRGNEYCEYPGECKSYIDNNNDGYCDYSIPLAEVNNASNPEPTQPVAASMQSNETVPSSTVPVAARTEAAESITQGGAAITETATAPAGRTSASSLFSVYNLVPIILVTLALYTASYILMNGRVIRLVAHRRIWNYLLLLTAAVSFVLSLMLTIQMEFRVDLRVPFSLIFWHVETGVVMSVIAVVHVLWHWRYFIKRIKSAGE